MSLNTINVRPIAYTKQITSIQLYLQYIFNQTECNITVYFRDEDGSLVKTEVVHIPSELYTKWSDDSVFINYILTQLNLTAA